MKTFLEKVLPALLGGAAGAIGALLAPWAKWGIDKRQARMDYRRAQLSRWRRYLHESYDDLGFSDTTYYSEMRPHLSKSTLAMIEGNMIEIREGRGGYVIKSAVLDDLSDLEQKWELI